MSWVGVLKRKKQEICLPSLPDPQRGAPALSPLPPSFLSPPFSSLPSLGVQTPGLNESGEAGPLPCPSFLFQGLLWKMALPLPPFFLPPPPCPLSLARSRKIIGRKNREEEPVHPVFFSSSSSFFPISAVVFKLKQSRSLFPSFSPSSPFFFFPPPPPPPPGRSRCGRSSRKIKIEHHSVLPLSSFFFIENGRG